MTTADRAHHYITNCRTSGDPIRLAEVERLCGLTNGSLHRFVLAALADLPTPPPRKKRASTLHDGWLALGARIYEAEKTEDHRAAISEGMRDYWKRRKSAAVAA